MNYDLSDDSENHDKSDKSTFTEPESHNHGQNQEKAKKPFARAYEKIMHLGELRKLEWTESTQVGQFSHYLHVHTQLEYDISRHYKLLLQLFPYYLP